MGVRKKAVSSKEERKMKGRKESTTERIASINNNQEDIHSMRVVVWVGLDNCTTSLKPEKFANFYRFCFGF